MNILNLPNNFFQYFPLQYLQSHLKNYLFIQVLQIHQIYLDKIFLPLEQKQLKHSISSKILLLTIVFMNYSNFNIIF